MPELLLELFSEEIPARMQPRAAEDLARLLGDGLKGHGLTFDTIRSFATPRRLTAVVEGLPARSPDVCEEKKGPRVGAPEAAVQGFLKSAGLAKHRASRGACPTRRATSTWPCSSGRGARRPRSSARSCPRSSATFPGRNRCAGAAGGCAGCGRFMPSSACSRARWCRSRSTASPPARRRAATASWRRSRSA